jgi:hypothetical protein
VTSLTLGTMTVSARANSVNPYGVCSRAPPTMLTGSAFSVQIRRSYQDCSRSGQRRPNTSVTIPVSKAVIPS